MAPTFVRGTALDRAFTDLTRACIVVAHNKLNPNQRFPRERWADDEIFRVERVLKAATNPAMTTTANWAQPLATVSVALLSNLFPTSGGADLLMRGNALNFAGAAQVNIPAFKIAQADFVRQGDPIPVVDGTVTIANSLLPCKFAVITTLTRELVESSNAEALIKTALLESIGPGARSPIVRQPTGGA